VQEEQKFKKAFKDPKFRDLMNDYMEEISDPKHRKVSRVHATIACPGPCLTIALQEQEAYIRQLEGDNKVPEDKEFMKPKPGFVVKTQKVSDKSKMFVNIVHSEKVEKATMERCDKGVNWQLPYTLGPLRQEKDKKGNLIPAIDCCYNPQTIARAQKDSRFKGLIVNTALDAVERAFKEVQKAEVKIDRKYTVLKGIAYKNGDPVLMMLSSSKKKEAFPHATADLAAKEVEKATAERLEEEESAREAANRPGATADELADDATGGAPTLQGLYDTLGIPEVKEKEEQQKKEEKRKKKKVKPAVKAGFLGKTKKKTKAIEEVKPTGPETPAYKLVERGQIDLSQFLTSDLAAHGQHSRPEELVAHISLPKLKSASGVELDVSERRLVVTDERNLYHLNVALPFPVQEDKGSAKFDKAKKRLTITMPVQPPTKEEKDQWRREAQDVRDAMQSQSIVQETSVESTGPEGEIDVAKDGEQLTVPYSADELEEQKQSRDEEARQMFATDATKLEDKEHKHWIQRGKDATLMRKTTKDEREKKKIHDHWIPAEDEQRDEVAEAVALAKLELVAHKKRQAAAKIEAEAAAKVQKENEARIKFEAMRKAAKKIEQRKSKKEYDYAPPPPYTIKQNSKNVTLLVQVPAVSKDTVHFDVTDELVELCFATQGHEGTPREQYRLAFKPAGKLNMLSCRHQVATKNMVVILAKAELGEEWPQLEALPEEPKAVEPEYVFKQNDNGAMLMVKVSGVCQDTVVADFQKDSVKIRFAAQEQEEQTHYALVVKPFGSIVPEKCRFDVATRNMVVVLWKEQQGQKWDSLHAQEDFIVSAAFNGAKPGYVFKLGSSGVGYYVDEGKPAEQPVKKQHRSSPPPEPNPEPTPEPTTTIQYGKPAVAKPDAQGSIDAGNVCFVNTMMYELD
jgi:HSP20 family molecular chaperone IbpA